MPRQIIRVELIGGASYTDYENLHAFMEKNNWFRYIVAKLNPGEVTKKLPSATYTGFSDNAPLNIASALTASIRSSVWSKAAVLVMQVGEVWAIAGDDIP
jgi:hypothetical protein